MNRSVFSFLSALVTLLFLSGCAGYRLGDAKPSGYAGIDRIFIPPFKNETLEPRLSSLVTNAVLKEVQVDGTYEVGSRSNCDAILVGVIREARKNQLRAVRNDTLKSQELSLYLFVDFHLEDPVTGEKIHNTTVTEKVGKSKQVGDDGVINAYQGRVIGDTIQFVDDSYQVGERNALSLAAQDLAEKLVSRLSNGW